MPFVREIRKKLGWTLGQEVPEYLKAVSWFDGDTGQLQSDDVVRGALGDRREEHAFCRRNWNTTTL